MTNIMEEYMPENWEGGSQLWTLVVKEDDEVKLFEKACKVLQDTPGIVILRKNDDYLILVFECSFPTEKKKKSLIESYPIDPNGAEWGYTKEGGPKISIW